MTLRDLFEDFETAERGLPSAPARSPEPASAPTDEDVRSEGFEAGYASGWEDGERSMAERHGRVSAEFERTIRDLGFTYHEALEQLQVQYVRLIEGFLEALFPAAVPELILETVRHEMSERSAGLADGSMNIVAAPGMVGLLERLVAEHFPDQITVTEESSLAENQAFIRLGETELMVDFETLVTRMREQLAALGSENRDLAVNE
ncbi:hypothetical protein GQ651_09930 [Alphaproteobacteria bacterium GH1-50]|uniref:Flagellar assembly protein FliH n=1 Tax=Kangsaoukella pontilimi TaxID=2691042 RepID=A0A7C9MW63_9RHOB|nr:hypothetical protein [Kangsaoukella pontilimi]MXQ08160.1 hypothetical protein [Kangsaoukella pontilimi]